MAQFVRVCCRVDLPVWIRQCGISSRLRPISVDGSGVSASHAGPRVIPPKTGNLINQRMTVTHNEVPQIDPTSTNAHVVDFYPIGKGHSAVETRSWFARTTSARDDHEGRFYEKASGTCVALEIGFVVHSSPSSLCLGLAEKLAIVLRPTWSSRLFAGLDQ